jgi:small subunit ribosomal protein S16
MLTVRLCGALSSFARLGSSERPRWLIPGWRRAAASHLVRWEKTTVVAVKIKLKRLGKIREPYYRIVVADARTKRDGRAIEEIGKYHPKAEPSFIEVNSDRVQHWLKVGAQPTDPVMVILKITGDWQKFKGEPGAEGTLRTAEPRADKKEAFAAAAKQSLATKEAKDAKENKSGSRSSRGARDGAAKDGAAKDTAAKDKDAGAKDGKAGRGKGGAAKAAESAAEPAAAEPAPAESVEVKAEAEPVAVAAEPVAAEAVSAEEGEAADAGTGSGA